jgi:hypothetical protein
MLARLHELTSERGDPPMKESSGEGWGAATTTAANSPIDDDPWHTPDNGSSPKAGGPPDSEPRGRKWRLRPNNPKPVVPPSGAQDWGRDTPTGPSEPRSRGASTSWDDDPWAE